VNTLTVCRFGSPWSAERALPRTIAEALSQQPEANLAIISTPGAYATAEARVMAALAAGEPLVEAYRFKKDVVNEITSAVTEWRRGR